MDLPGSDPVSPPGGGGHGHADDDNDDAASVASTTSNASSAQVRKPLKDLSKDDLIAKCKGLLIIAQKAKAAKDGN